MTRALTRSIDSAHETSGALEFIVRAAAPGFKISLHAGLAKQRQTSQNRSSPRERVTRLSGKRLCDQGGLMMDARPQPPQLKGEPEIGSPL